MLLGMGSVLMTIHSPLSLGLTEQQLAQVAEVVINWAAVDTMLGYCLNHALSDEGQRLFSTSDIFEQDISEKVRMLSLVRKTTTLPPDRSALCKELLSVYGTWGGDRNLVAHGMATQAVDGEVALHSERKNAAVSASELSRYVSRSRYAVHVVMRLNMKFAGVLWDPLGPLPDRPD